MLKKELYIFSISHQSASVELREKFSISKTETADFLRKLKEVLGIEEAIVLSTCNRTDIYYLHPIGMRSAILKFICAFKTAGESDVYKKYVFSCQGDDALKYLFRLSIGLESQIFGDLQIYSQLKDAYQLATDADMVKSYLHRLMHSIFYTHKQILNQTSFQEGALSASYNTAKKINQLIESRSDKMVNVLVIGAGQMGKDLCDHLAKFGIENVAITNRTLEKAKAIADAYDFAIFPFDEHKDLIPHFDIIVSTIEQGSFLYQKSDFLNATTLAVFDLGAPRTVSPEVAELCECFYDIDQIAALTETTLAFRKNEVPKVEQLIDEAVEQFNLWLDESSFTPTVRQFKEALEELRKSTLSNYMKEMSTADYEVVEEVTSKVIQKIINIPVVQLKTACQRGNVEQLNQSLKELFMLDENQFSETKS
ncbi:glutamyl-tRNA reductase [Sediminitomix flava]|uniref:Glutamyl-tRNA reductase n=1 Tax=Sediminitomix flava TaxID=379075 RepID=A0A315ZBE8_SEDFL|nr:glutamyl-tRNA reductase [Sediminitomix flava]PWJ42871.1 glutamyl-tRNA reductase [Sediminitomix flava]